MVGVQEKGLQRDWHAGWELVVGDSALALLRSALLLLGVA
jgi:hypothetical protein